MSGTADPAGEWPSGLDVAALLASGFRPSPFRQVVLKLASRCDLACDYCYVYELADQGWRTSSVRMAPEVVDATSVRVAEHAQLHDLDEVEVVLHGGEPLLAGSELIVRVAQRLRADLPDGTRLRLRLQTNGVLLDEEILDVLAAHGVGVGISLDGDRTAHDRHRRRADGRGSYDAVCAGLELLTSRHPGLFAGLLCTIDLRNDPVSTFESLLGWSPPMVDLLLPHGTWSAPPPGRAPAGTDAPYGRWLATAFDRWYDAPRRETRVRYFEEIVHLLLGGASRVETVGLSPVQVVVVDTDGYLEQVDTLRAAFDGAAATGLHVRTHSFDAALEHPGIVARQLGLAALSDTCRACSVVSVCGGGYYPHRYRRGVGFQQPSVYCPDLLHLVRHVASRVAADVVALPRRPSVAGC